MDAEERIKHLTQTRDLERYILRGGAAVLGIETLLNIARDSKKLNASAEWLDWLDAVFKPLENKTERNLTDWVALHDSMMGLLTTGKTDRP